MTNERKSWLGLFVLVVGLLTSDTTLHGQSRPIPVRVAYSALSAGIGTLWLTQEQGFFRKHGLDANLVYMRSGTTAVQALLAGDIEYGHL